MSHRSPLCVKYLTRPRTTTLHSRTAHASPHEGLDGGGCLPRSEREEAVSARLWGSIGMCGAIRGVIPTEYDIVVESDYLQITWEHRNEGVLTEGSGLLRLLGSRLTEQGSYLGLALSSMLWSRDLLLQGIVEGTHATTIALVRIRPCL